MPPRVNQAAVVNNRARENTRPEEEEERLVGDAGDDFQDLNADDKATRALQVVRELYKRYKKQTERWENYISLFSFLIFVAIFLSVLFLQRNAQVAYAVHSTIKDTLVPSSTTLSSSSEVLDWLQGTLAEIWKDPVCGDGVCETPFEFASYGRFGCRADCGRLSEVQNLTTVMIDLNFDFSHPVGSVPATELMQQASWNLCPLNGAPHGTDCYYPTDRQFDRISGEVHLEINDVPDGNWALVVKRDIFNKVSGAVRNKQALEEEAFTQKISIAAMAAEAARQFEVKELEKAEAVAKQTFPELIGDYLNFTWNTYLANRTSLNATGLFNSAGVYNATKFEEWEALWYPFKDPVTQALVDVDLLMPGEYQSALGNSDHMYWYKATLECSNIPQIHLDGSAVSQPTSTNCLRYENITISAVERRLTVFLTTIYQRSFQRDAYRKRLLSDTLAALAVTKQEVVTSINSLTGRDPQNNPGLATLEELTAFYREPIAPAPANAPLSQNRLNSLNWVGYDEQTASFETALDRIADRILEIGDMATMMTALPEVQAMEAYMANEATESATYNYVTWNGGPNAYMTTNLTYRAPDYVGVCREDVVVTQALESDPVANLTYRTTSVPQLENENSQRFIDLSGCIALCYCTEQACTDSTSTGNTNAELFEATYCECEVCRSELQDPVKDASFQTIQQSFTSAGAAAAGVRHRRHQRRLLANDPNAVAAHKELLHLKHAAHRRLQQADTGDSALLNQLITDVSSLSSQQTGLSDQVSSLEQEVIRASTAAEQRAADKTLEDLITAGRQDIKDGQERVENLLAEIIEKQNEAAAAAEEAAAALAQIQELQTAMAKSQQLVELGVQKQLQAIMVAGQQQMITLEQALTLWRKARIDRLKYQKQVQLSNLQTGNFSTVAYGFSVARYNSTDPDTARERHIGLTNRVIAGMLLHTTRTEAVECKTKRFQDIDNTCTGSLDTSTYGVDPVFKRGANMYNSDLDNQLSVTTYYNCSNLGADPMYDLVDPVNEGASTNPAPYCAELFNERNIPWGFHHYPLKHFEDGFPVWFDINLSEDVAQRFYKYVEEGLFLDSNTRNVKAQVVTYNSELRVFSSTMITFKYSDGGSIDVSHKLHTVRVELYADRADYVRLCLEIFLTAATMFSLVSELWELFTIWRRTGSPAGYFKSIWNWIDLTSIGLMWCTMCMWWIFVLRQASTFDISLRYDVYASLTSPAAMLILGGQGDAGGQGLVEVQDAFGELQSIVDSLAWYYAINGINILFLIARVLKLMDFQPRLGVVTRSLALAGPDLAHFVLVCGMVFVGYAMMAHLIFGNNIQAFSSFGSSVDTCFEILLGEIGVNTELRALTGLQALAGTLFFWSFELLVFMVLLNFLLAIIVDAFSEVKENTTEQTGIHTEVAQMVAEKWRSVTSCFGRGQHIPDRRLGQLLKQWGGDEEDEDDNAGSNEKHLRLLQTNLNSDDLTEILKECLAASSEADFDAESGKKGLFGKGKGKAGMPSEEEIAMAAEYVVARFGQSKEEDEEAEEEDGGDEGAGTEAVPITSATGEHLYTEKALEKERDALAQALDRLSEVQRQLAEGQQKLMSGQSQLKGQHERLLDLMSSNK
eukprot:CAMPEP_0117652658 /NCGR_PEP_ID=MMETSP0804-20121206/2750_1 /TAXON_ID=1074897 /ORGANISM="Tetraselmis astigmatica, Strain CCMP880" /LENGTH=1606 /DNA_ID=CAMNT_0005458731 /DNA_START=90 /DNA_END=4910 /DNA_ORIENTATION=+